MRLRLHKSVKLFPGVNHGLALAVLFCFFSHTVYAQKPGEVLKAFRTLEARTEAGMTFDEYANGVADVNAQLKNFADSNQGRQTPASIKALQAALEQYQNARAAWDEQKIRDIRYENSELSIKAYFDRKQQFIGELQIFWRAAKEETDRAAKLVNQKGIK